jgi:predicted urease superfamily metal-dependent hydrolase
MQYTSEQIEQVSEWYEEQYDDSLETAEIAREFQVLKAIVVTKTDPQNWFNNLMEWALENIEHEVN